MNGTVESRAGNVSRANLKVALYDAGSGQSVKVAEAVSDTNGAFAFPDGPGGPPYFGWVTVTSSDQITLMAILGTTRPGSFKVNELTTVAACYAGAQFITTDASGVSFGGTPFALSIVAAMNANLVDVTTGVSSTVITTPPNGDETNAWRSTLSLANVVASWVGDPAGFAVTLSKLANLPGGTPPKNTIDALTSIARNPAKFVGGLYAQSKTLSPAPYQPVLERQPDAWTVVVKVNDSGNDSMMFAGPGSVSFDSQGRAWIPNNVQQGEGTSADFSIVLDLSGRPATDAGGNTISPFTGGGIKGPGLGAAVDGAGNVWIGDFGWGNDFPVGSVSVFDANAKPLSPEPNGYTLGNNYRVQGTVVDTQQNVWMACYGNGSVVVYRGELTPDGYIAPIPPKTFASYQGGDSVKPFCIAIAADGTAWMTDSNTPSSGIVHLQLTGSSTLQLLERIDVGQTLKGIAIDSSGNIWVASGGDDHIYLYDRDGNFIGGYQGGGIDGPWGIALDGDDNLWVGNFGPLELGSNFHGRLTQLAGVNATGHRLGDGLTPQTGYTLPSAGEQVLLHDSTPLYGHNGPPCFIPMMRTTGVNIDAAGNVWTCNNWKPNFDIDAIGGATGNPGGDGMLIWVGLAKPVRR
jgi:streptogramin lyase